jgi:2-phospho-L-lactate guanylyltransferase
VTADAIDDFVDSARITADGNPGRSTVGLVPDRHGTGTNALIVSPACAIDFEFGEGSRSAHTAAAAQAGAAYFEMDGPLSFDVDTPEDLLQADMAGLGHEAGR